jgi:TfoX/Sxy family transcriptional regulator of competence genes
MAYDDELADRVRETVGREKGVTEKKMFGGLAFLINGNLAVAASSKGGLMLRVDPTETETLLRDGRAEPFEMHGRSMNGWLRIKADDQTPDDELADWVRRGVSYAKSLPPK